MPPKVERVLEGLLFGEAPHWDVATQSLYFVNAFADEICKFVPSTNKYRKAKIPDKTATFIIPVEGHHDKFISALNREVCIVTWDGESPNVKSVQPLVEVDTTPDKKTNVLNDGKCDSSGRLWTGTVAEFDMKTASMKDVKGSIYSLSANKELKQHTENIAHSNGIAFSSDDKKFYFVDSGLDSFANTVTEYDFDVASGTISNPKVVFTAAKHGLADGLLDGMTIDTDGKLWIAVFNRSRVIKIDPRTPETLLETINLPAMQTTSLIFGGPNLDELYVTTGGFTINGRVPKRPEEGALYKISETGSKGYPGYNFRL